MIAAEIVTMMRGRPSENTADCGISRPKAAQLLNTDEAGVERARTVLATAPIVAKAVKDGHLTRRGRAPAA
jgi:hypothetical protein